MCVAWQPYPPGPFFSDGRWSNGPVWAGLASCIMSCPTRQLCIALPQAFGRVQPVSAISSLLCRTRQAVSEGNGSGCSQVCHRMQSMSPTQQAFSSLTWQWAHLQPTKPPASMAWGTSTRAVSCPTKGAHATSPCPLSMRLSTRKSPFTCSAS